MNFYTYLFLNKHFWRLFKIKLYMNFENCTFLNLKCMYIFLIHEKLRKKKLYAYGNMTFTHAYQLFYLSDCFKGLFFKMFFLLSSPPLQGLCIKRKK